MGDGCAMEGISHEAASLAAHWKLNKLTLIYDDNHNTIDGPTTLAFSEDISARFKALGWNTITVENIHSNINSFKDALHSAFSENEKPTFIRVCGLAEKLIFCLLQLSIINLLIILIIFKLLSKTIRFDYILWTDQTIYVYVVTDYPHLF